MTAMVLDEPEKIVLPGSMSRSPMRPAIEP